MINKTNNRIVQFNDVEKSYKTVKNAKKQIAKFEAQFEMLFPKKQYHDYTIRFTIIVRDDGRFVPVVLMSGIDQIPGATSYGINNKFGVCLLG